MAFRGSILKLATKISLASLTYTGITPNDPEYKILDPVVTDEMAEICLHIKLNTASSTEEIAKRARKSVEYTNERISELKKAGIVRSRIIDGEERYYYPIWVPGIMEGMLSNKEQCEKHPVIAECFEEYTRKRTAVLAPNMGVGMGFMRVIPVEKAISSESRAASYDEISHLIENAHTLSVGPCSCRRSRRLMGEGCGHLEDDMCMYLNDNAVNFIKNGTHREITKKEAYEVLKRAEDNGLIHEINQTDGCDEVTAICNCCGCSCYALRIAEYFRTPDFIRSNFVARVDKDKCVACGLCVESCNLNALKLGQRLCSVTPDAPQAPEDLPFDTIWSSKRYNVDYRTDRELTTEAGTSPCKAKCPAHVPVQGYINLASQGRYLEALELIKNENPFPAVCGRICNKKCEDACTRGSIDSAVAIDDIKKFIADKELFAETRYVPAMLNPTGKPYTNKIAIIGSGPAGLSCAYYLALRGYPVTVFEKEEVLGGMLTLGIPSFRLEKDVIISEIDVLRAMGVEFRTGVEVGRDLTVASLREEGFEAFYLAIGAQNDVPLGVAGEDLEGVFGSIKFLRDTALGKAPALGKRAAVIGGGNVAMDVARTAVRLGCEEVTVIYRRTEKEMPANAEEIEEAVSEGIRFRYLAAPEEIIGGDSKVEKLKLRLMKLGEPDASGRRAPVPTGDFEIIEVDSVISSIGQQVEWGGLAKGTAIRMNRNKTICADSFTYQTDDPDIFAGGDVYTGPKYAIDAIAAGKEAATSIHRHVHPGQSLIIGRDHRNFKEMDKSNAAIGIESFDSTPRQRTETVDGKVSAATFRDLRGTLTEEQMKKETARCLGCGAASVDENMCVGCGICTTKCKFDAIKLEKVHDEFGSSYFKKLGGAIPYVAKRVARIAVKKVTAPISKK